MMSGLEGLAWFVVIALVGLGAVLIVGSRKTGPAIPPCPPYIRPRNPNVPAPGYEHLSREWVERRDQVQAAIDEQFHIAEAREDGWCDWQSPVMDASYRMRCCGCGLVHQVEFRVVEVDKREGDSFEGNIAPAEQYRVQLRMRRC